MKRPPPILRFLYVHPVKFPGVEANLVQTAETCRALAERGHEVFLIASGLDGAPTECLAALDVEPHDRLFLVGEPAIRLKNSSGARSWAVRAMLLWYLRNLVRRGRTVLYFRTLKDSRLARFLLLASRLLRVPVVYEAHKLYAEKRADQGFHEGTLRRIGRLESAVLDGVDAVVASHPALAEEISGPHPARSVTVAPNGVRRAEPAREPSLYDAVYAGSLFPWKGVDICIEAVARVDGCRLAIVGGNPESRLDELETKARELGVADRVSLLGQRPRAEALEVVARSRVALVPLDPAYEEGERYTCPLKMLEAMVRGVPVVGADTAALREFVTDDQSALLYPKGDAAAMAAAIRRLRDHTDVAERIAREARRIALEMSFAGRAARIELVARSVLESR